MWKPGRAVRLLGVAAAGLRPPSRQLGLREKPGPAHSEKLAETVDALPAKYGHKALRRASLADEEQNGES